MDFGPKAPTPTALKQPIHTQKSIHQQHSVSCVNLKKNWKYKNMQAPMLSIVEQITNYS